MGVEDKDRNSIEVNLHASAFCRCCRKVWISLTLSLDSICNAGSFLLEGIPSQRTVFAQRQPLYQNMRMVYYISVL